MLRKHLAVDDVLKRKRDAVLVDARPHNEYLGDDDLWLRKGHIPGAISFHWARLMETDNTHKFLPFEKVKAELEKAGLTADKEILVYCGTSREGSLLRFYLKYVAKYPNVRLYEGSWKEYASLKQYPTETKENKAGAAETPKNGTGIVTLEPLPQAWQPGPRVRFPRLAELRARRGMFHR